MERAEAEAIFDQGRDVVVAVLLRLDEQVRRLEKRVVAQDERIAKLERQLSKSSRNSSQPPSADPPSAPPRSKSPTGRKQGAQPGMRARAGRCCRRGRSTRSSSTGRPAVAAGTCSARPIASRWASRRVVRSRSCR